MDSFMDNKQVIDFLIAFGYHKEEAERMLASSKGVYYKSIFAICRKKIREISCKSIENDNLEGTSINKRNR